MFGKKETDAKPLSKNVSTNASVSYLAEGCEVKGSFIAKGNARIDGKVEGTINVTGDLDIGQSAVLKANIQGQTISIADEVHGNVNAMEFLDLNSTARLFGDINTKDLRIQQGARFVGKSNHSENAEENALSDNPSGTTDNDNPENPDEPKDPDKPNSPDKPEDPEDSSAKPAKKAKFKIT